MIAGRHRVHSLQFEVTKERRKNIPGVSLKIFANHEMDRAAVYLAIRLRDRIGPRVEAIARTYNRMYENGDETLLEMIDARRTLLKTRMKALDTVIKAQIECGRLAAFLGKEKP